MVLCYSSLKELRHVLRLCKIISFLKELLFLWWPHKENWLNGTWKLWYYFCNFLWVKLHYNKTLYRSKLIITNIWATVWTQVAKSQPLCPFVQRSKPSSPLLVTRWQFPKSPSFPCMSKAKWFLFGSCLSSTTWLLEQHPFLFDPQFFLLGSHRLPSTPARVWRDLPKSAHQPQSPLTLVHEPSHSPCICVRHSYCCLTFSGEERREVLFRILLFTYTRQTPRQSGGPLHYTKIFSSFP